MKIISALVVVLLLCMSALGADPEPFLKSARMPFYPPLAHQARIQGEVTLHFIVNELGDTSDVQVDTGHELLRQSAADNIRGWKFVWPHPCTCSAKRKAVFVYTVSNGNADAVVKWFGRTGTIRVEVEDGGITINTVTGH